MQNSRLKLHHLNPEQRDAATHGHGPLLILAGAGSGKTSTMSYRIAHLVADRRISPSTILGLSFTNKAARELRHRVNRLLQPFGRGVKTPRITTFHSLCVYILRQHAPLLGYTSQFSIVDDSDQEAAVRRILRHLKIDDRKFDPRALLFRFGSIKNRGLTQEQAVAEFLGPEGKDVSDYGIAAAEVYPKYLNWLKTQNSMDFDDLLMLTAQLFKDFEDVRSIWANRFEWILVDEYQDTNATQFQLIRQLTQERQNICVVGDDDQSIYAWRGAQPSLILEFETYYPGAKRVILDQNYRSTQNILDASHHLISKNTKRYPKKLWNARTEEHGPGEPVELSILEDDRAETEWVADQILVANKEGRSWKDFAILYRSNTQSRLFEEALRLRKIPYELVGGYRFLDRKEVKDILSHWRLLLNSGDENSGRRAITFPARGVGKTSLEKVQTFVIEQGIPWIEGLEKAGLTEKSKAGVRHFLDCLSTMRQRLEVTEATAEGISNFLRWTLEFLEFKKHLETDSDSADEGHRRWEIVEDLAQGCGQLKPEEIDLAPGESLTAAIWLREYLARLTLNDSDEEETSDTPKVTLLTLHGAKGLEFPVVYLVGLEDGLLPHQRVLDEVTDLSEERRLCYVGMTRAKERLTLTRARTRIRYGKTVPRNPSRFLSEIPEEMLLVTNLSLVQSPLTASASVRTQEAAKAHELKVSDFLQALKNSVKNSSPTR